MDRLESARVFIAIAEQGSLAAAARSLGLSRAMVTRHLAHMEYWAGARLLHRNSRSSSLTGAGEATLERSRTLLALAGDIPLPDAAPGPEPDQLQGTLRITCPTMFAVRVLVRAVSDFQHRHPLVRIDLQASNATTDLVQERIDLALRFTRKPAPGLIARPLGTCLLAACAAPAYLESRGTPSAPGELAQHNCLTYLYAGQNLWGFHHAQGDTDVSIDGNLGSNEPDVLLAATLAGAGISVLPLFAIAPHIDEGRLVPLFPEHQSAPMTLYAAYTTRRHMPAALRALIDYLPGWLADDPVWRHTTD